MAEGGTTMARLFAVVVAVMLSACAADDADLGDAGDDGEVQGGGELSFEEFAERRATASCSKLAECYEGFDVDACMRDLDILFRSMHDRAGWPADQSEPALAECEDWIASAECWHDIDPQLGVSPPSPWDVPECDFGGAAL